VPGRKSDVLDCQWLQKLMSLGLLRAAWRPGDKVCVVRAVVRQREVEASLMTETVAPDSYTILIVDDTPANLGVVVEGLEDRGFRVVVAEDGEEGVQRAEFVRPDLILLDVMMPGLSGFEACRRLKALDSTRDIPVMFMTSLTDTESKVTGFGAGGVDYVTKPLEIKEVIARVNTHLSLNAMRKQLEAQNTQLQQEIMERRQAEEALQASRDVIRRQRDELQALYDKVVAEQKVSERLLLNLLPSLIAERLKARADLVIGRLPEIIADSFPQATVLFADIVQFTRFSAGMSPEKLVAVLNEIFTDFDGIADERGLEKIKTIGDAYMAAAGLPVPTADHAARAAHMALDMMDAVARFDARTGYKLQLRIGLNSGAVVAGVIGKHKFIYDLWGDAVNIASRMQSQGVAGRVQVTEITRRLLGKAFVFEERGTISAKGTGKLHTWFLVGRASGSPESGATGPLAPGRGEQAA
jgi:adenylate cyclase